MPANDPTTIGRDYGEIADYTLAAHAATGHEDKK
jgi:hypothetical protein